MSVYNWSLCCGCRWRHYLLLISRSPTDNGHVKSSFWATRTAGLPSIGFWWLLGETKPAYKFAVYLGKRQGALFVNRHLIKMLLGQPSSIPPLHRRPDPIGTNCIWKGTEHRYKSTRSFVQEQRTGNQRSALCATIRGCNEVATSLKLCPENRSIGQVTIIGCVFCCGPWTRKRWWAYKWDIKSTTVRA